ncbi:MAG: ABC transporter ATP-binding protein [Pseudomonadota bacterium]
MEHLDVTLSGRRILKGLSARVQPGGVTTIIGPNGCGKSTLLRCLARIVRPDAGRVMLDGEDAWSVDPRGYARKVAFMSQSPSVPEGLHVRGLVERGRTSYLGAFRPFGPDDRAAVDDALAACGLDGLAGRRVDRLSGGQRQRAWIAMALAQSTPVLLLDEPTSFLDLPHQIEVMRLVRRLNETQRITVVMVLHEINLAASYSDMVIAMRDGQIVTSGAPSEVIRADVLETLFGVALTVHPRAAGRGPIVLPV